MDENGDPRGPGGRRRDEARVEETIADEAAEAGERGARKTPRARDASGKKWFSDQFIRNASIFAGACLGATYEVATMPTTVQNFNKAVYATTGYVAESLPKALSRHRLLRLRAGRALRGGVLRRQRGRRHRVCRGGRAMIGIFTGMGESALNFVCIPFTWTYAKRFVDEFCRRRCETCRDDDDAETRSRSASPRSSWRRSRRSRRSRPGFVSRPRVLVLRPRSCSSRAGSCGSWASPRRGCAAPRSESSSASCPRCSADQRLREAMPAVHVVPGLRKAAEHLGAGAGAALKAGSAAAKVAGKGVKSSAKARGPAPRRARGSLSGRRAPPPPSPAPRWGAAVGAAAAKTTVYGFLAGAKGGVRAGLAAGDLVLRGTAAAGSAPSSGRRSLRGAAPGKCARLFGSPPCRRRRSWTWWRPARAGRRARERSGRRGTGARRSRSSGCEDTYSVEPVFERRVCERPPRERAHPTTVEIDVARKRRKLDNF